MEHQIISIWPFSVLTEDLYVTLWLSTTPTLLSYITARGTGYATENYIRMHLKWLEIQLHTYVAIHLTIRMEIFGCNNLVSYKVATRLKILWILYLFYLVKWL